MSTDIDPRAYLQKALAKADAATGGVWEVEHGRVRRRADALMFDPEDIAVLVGGEEWVMNAEFIASARSAAPRMARTLLAVLDVLDEYEPVDPHPETEPCPDCDMIRDARRVISRALGGEGR